MVNFYHSSVRLPRSGPASAIATVEIPPGKRSLRALGQPPTRMTAARRQADGQTAECHAKVEFVVVAARRRSSAVISSGAAIGKQGRNPIRSQNVNKTGRTAAGLRAP